MPILLEASHSLDTLQIDLQSVSNVNDNLSQCGVDTTLDICSTERTPGMFKAVFVSKLSFLDCRDYAREHIIRLML